MHCGRRWRRRTENQKHCPRADGNLCVSAAQFDEMYKDAPVIVDLDERVGLEAGNSGDGNKPEPTEDEKLIANVNAYFNKGE